MSTPESRRAVSSGSPYEPLYGFSRAVRVGNLVAVSGTAPIRPDGSCEPDPAVQTARCIEIIQSALEEAGASIRDVFRTRIFITDAAIADEVGIAHGASFGDVAPASSMLVVAALLRPEWKVEIEADALISE